MTAPGQISRYHVEKEYLEAVNGAPKISLEPIPLNAGKRHAVDEHADSCSGIQAPLGLLWTTSNFVRLVPLINVGFRNKAR
jgi:hypothetical protein